MKVNVMTYKKLMEKYPDMKDDLEELQEDKNTGLNYNRLACLLLGIFFTIMFYHFGGLCYV